MLGSGKHPVEEFSDDEDWDPWDGVSFETEDENGQPSENYEAARGFEESEEVKRIDGDHVGTDSVLDPIKSNDSSTANRKPTIQFSLSFC